MGRLFWLGVGAVAGASGTVWAERKVKNRLDALQPDHLVVVAGNHARSVGRFVVDAVAEGRGAMREREAQLRTRLDLDRVGSQGPGRPGGARAAAPVRATRPPVRPMSADRRANPSPSSRHR